MLLVYGSYGCTGRLVVERALEVFDGDIGPVVLAGRDAAAVEAQAVAHDLTARVFTVEHDAVVRDRIRDADAVLNCAGPFRATADPLVGACLDTGTHYLDVTGELRVFEALAEYDAAAARRDLTVLPGTGFDVVATDCLAASLAGDAGSEAADGALALAVRHVGGVSRGTLRTAIERLDEGGAVRRDGRIERVPIGHDRRTVDFRDGEGPTRVVAVPWGDLVTAHRSTGVPDVVTYAALGRPADALLGSEAGVRALSFGPVRRAIGRIGDRLERDVLGPTGGETHVWGEFRTDGSRRVGRLQLPDAYAFTARAAVESARRVLAGDAPGGVHTPSSAFGTDYVRSFEGVTADGPETQRYGSGSGSGPLPNYIDDPESGPESASDAS